MTPEAKSSSLLNVGERIIGIQAYKHQRNNGQNQFKSATAAINQVLFPCTEQVFREERESGWTRKEMLKDTGLAAGAIMDIVVYALPAAMLYLMVDGSKIDPSSTVVTGSIMKIAYNGLAAKLFENNRVK